MTLFQPRNVKIEPITIFWEGRQSHKSLPQKVGFEPGSKRLEIDVSHRRKQRPKSHALPTELKRQTG